MMSALLVLIVVLAVHSLVLPGSGEGLRFYLMPDFKRAADVGIGKVITAAMNQAFFTRVLVSVPWRFSEVICRAAERSPENQ